MRIAVMTSSWSPLLKFIEDRTGMILTREDFMNFEYRDRFWDYLGVNFGRDALFEATNLWRHAFFSESGTFYWRLKVPAKAALAQGHDICYITNFHCLRKLHFDAVIGTRQASMVYAADSLRICLERGLRVIYETDDWHFHLPDWNPSKPFIEPTGVDACIQSARAVTVTTENLAKEMRGRFPGKPVYICPNCLQPKDWPEWQRERRSNRHIPLIVWGGSATHEEDFNDCVEALKTLKEKGYKFNLLGLGEPSSKFRALPGCRVTGRLPIPQFMQAWVSYAPDIVLAPLSSHAPDKRFNDCKSHVKWLEAAFLHAPLVCDNVGAYDFIPDAGIYRCNGAKDWVDNLARLLDDKALMRAEGERAYECAMDCWTIEKRLPEFLAAWGGLNDAVIMGESVSCFNT